MKAFTVLIAEDDMLSRMVLERSVVQWGHQMVSAVDGEAARVVLQTQNVDVCILDWDMPRMTGIELCKWLKSSESKAVPYVIMLTSNCRPEDVKAGYEAGADDYIVKPGDLKYLRRKITAVAEKACPEQTERQKADGVADAGLTPLDIHLSNIRILRPSES
jgi:DNA-binding response OmpR family regulator